MLDSKWMPWAIIGLWVWGGSFTPAALKIVQSACIDEQTKAIFVISGPIYWAITIVVSACVFAQWRRRA
jgi:hypothetical protein